MHRDTIGIEAMILIWSNEHRAWWKRNSLGYTADISEAGIFSEEHVEDICRRATLDWTKEPNEVPVRVDDLPDEAVALVGSL